MSVEARKWAWRQRGLTASDHPWPGVRADLAAYHAVKATEVVRP